MNISIKVELKVKGLKLTIMPNLSREITNASLCPLHS